MRYLVVIFLLCALPTSALAVPPNYIFKWIEVSSDLESNVEEYHIALTCLEGRIEHIDVAGVKLTDATDSKGNELRVENLPSASRIFFKEPIRSEESLFVYARTEGLSVRSMDGNILYYRSFAFPKKVERFTYRVTLPEGIFPEVKNHERMCTENCTCEEGGPCTCENCLSCLTCVVSSWKSATTIPPDEIMIKDNRLNLIWTKTLAANEIFQVGILYPERKPMLPLYFAGIVTGVAAIFSAGFIIAKNKRKSEVVQVFLNEEEKCVTDFIKENGGEVLQKEIWKAPCVGFSRPKVSRIIADLEKRGVIRRKPFKKTFKVVLIGY
jgi:hypothetical protein